jgi:signal transduction histidine kinase
VVTVALSAFGWRLNEQQQAIDTQRSREQLGSNADALLASVRGRMAEVGERLSEWLSNPAQAPAPLYGVALLSISADEVTAGPGPPLPFVPVVPSPLVADEVFAAGEAAEFARGDLTSAAERYRATTKHSDAVVRAAALARLGRVLRKSQDLESARRAYEELSGLKETRVDQLPASLAALVGLRATLRAMGKTDDERQVTSELRAGLEQGRWLIARGVAELYRDQVGASIPAAMWMRASALSDAWDQLDRAQSRGQRVVATDEGAVLVIWRSSARRTALALGTEQLFADAGSLVSWQLADADNRRLFGAEVVPADAVEKVVAAETPWILHVWSTAADASPGGGISRFLLMLIGAMVAFVWGATYFMARALRREAQVARLQSDFVAAVSHEFRSPLTALRQMAEMLEMGRLTDETRRQQYYRHLVSETSRLQRLVETLLNFGRMEAGATTYRFTAIDAGVVVRQVVSEIASLARAEGKTIEVVGPASAVTVRADENALAVALRNLIDNAIKYSPGETTVRVEWSGAVDRAAIRVIDHGVGISYAERDAVFERFVRGRAATEMNVKGTGVGLAMVRHIIHAHSGEIQLESEPGRGSTFTLLLPAA